MTLPQQGTLTSGCHQARNMQIGHCKLHDHNPGNQSDGQGKWTKFVKNMGHGSQPTTRSDTRRTVPSIRYLSANSSSLKISGQLRRTQYFKPQTGVGVNLHQVPVNCPFMAQFASLNFDGQMRVDANHAGNKHYAPDSFAHKFRPDTAEAPYAVGENIVSERVTIGTKARRASMISLVRFWRER
ncbi:hypothetical protein GGS21DRAFT_488928 [Xylaria nigripes]|nr:hypothetical protein GGS21DRAFT_488928 [Xylaria nigripes]